MKIFAPDRYEKITYRRCGRSGLRLPMISLGFWQWLGEAGNADVCREIMYYALDHGVTHFDLANNYGPPPGNSEQVVGRVLRDMPRDELIISTKAGFTMWSGPYGDWGSKKYLVASLDQSLKRLGLDYMDIFYHHRPDPETPMDEIMGALDLIVKQGKALYAGVSNYPGELFRYAVEVIRRHDWTPITIHQPSYNFLRRTVETDLLPHTTLVGTGVIAFCPLAQGVLTDRYIGGLPPDSRMGRRGKEGQAWWEKQKAAGVWDKVSRLNEIAKARGQTMAQMALAWILRLPGITSTLVGVSSVKQLEQNLAALNNLKFSEEELKRIDEITLPRP